MRRRAWTRRWLRIAGVILVPLAVVSCSHASGPAASSPGHPAACAYVTKLDAIASTVASADVNDPAAFTAALNAAVSQYVANVRALRTVVPADLDAGLGRVEADVQQHRFDAALVDRAALDAYAQRACGRLPTAPTTATTIGATTSVAPATGPSTTLATTSSTAPSDG